MVYGFANQSGGHTVIQSEAGKGTTVSIYLPRYSGPVQPKALHRPVKADTGPKRVLLVEDESDVRELVASMLDSLGHEVQSTADGEHALRQIDGWKPDVLITDVVLSGPMTGTDLARQIQDSVPQVKVLLISGYPEYALDRDGSLASTLPLLKKPFGGTALQSAMNTLFS